MNQKKNKKILIILIIVTLILILMAGGAIAYFTTDIFKSDKELFFKYIGQITDKEKGLFSEDIIQYLEKRNNTPFNNESKISFDFSEEGNKEEFKSVNDFNISFSGQVDNANSKISQDISLNYSENVKFPLNYRKVGNIIGIQSKYFSPKFIAVDTSSLSGATGNLSTVEDVSESIKKLENIEKIDLSEEKRNNIINKYIDIINQQLDKDKFSKVQESDLTGYKLSLSGQDIKNILVKILETLKEDQETIDVINEYLKVYSNSSKIASNNIESTIKSIQSNSDIDNKEIELTVYKDKGVFRKLSFKLDETIINIEKKSESNKKSISISVIDKGDQIININVNLEGLVSMQNIKENYEIEFILPPGLNEDIKNKADMDISFEDSYIQSNRKTYKYIIDNDINFTDVSTIEELSDQNSLILTNYDTEQVNEFLNKVIERTIKINKDQMEELNLEEDKNPILSIIPSFGTSFINTRGNIFGDTSANMSESETQAFNKKFEIYEDTNLSGQTTKGLLSTISLNNEDESNYKIKEINFNGEEYDTTEQNIVFIKEDIDLSKNYKVEFEKDENTGIIYRVIINVK